MIKAAFFDFNGTLYFDADINKISWNKTIDRLSNGKIDFESFYPDNKAVMDYLCIKAAFKLLGEEKSDEEIEYWVQEKEKSYRQTCIDLKRDMLSAGAKEVLDYLKDNNVPMILVTSSIKENVDFYFKNVQLGNWFDRNEVVHDTGEYNSKTQMYLKAAQIANVDIKDCVIFEDSPKSIREAIETGCNKIVKLRDEPFDNKPLQIRQEIADFTYLDYSIFE